MCETSHVFTQTAGVVAASHRFACLVIPATWLCIPSFMKIRSGVLEPPGGGVEIWQLVIGFYNHLYYYTGCDIY